MEFTAYCRNESCGQNGVAKASNGVRLLDGESVLCGECGQPCEILEGATT